MHLLETETFSNTFGPKSQRKKPKLKAACLDDMAGVVDTMLESYKEDKDGSCLANTATDGVLEEAKDPIFSKGQSKRIWNELYKVVDSSDVVIHVLDARNPEGTRCRNVERYLKAEAPHKHLIFVLNKCDLVPTWVTVSEASFFCNLLLAQLPSSLYKEGKLHCYVKRLYCVLAFGCVRLNNQSVSVTTMEQQTLTDLTRFPFWEESNGLEGAPLRVGSALFPHCW